MKPSAGGSRNGDAVGGIARGVSVLVVFDSPSVRETLSVVELGDEFEVSVCDRPDSVQEEIERIRPGLVAICCVTNPERPRDLCREIKSKHEGYLPVVLLPVKVTTSELEQAYSAGADDCIPITMAPEQVAMRLRSLLRAKEAHDRAMTDQATSAETKIRGLAQANLEAADLVLEIEERDRRIREQNDELGRRARSLASANAEAAKLVLDIEERDRRIEEQSAEIAKHLRTLEDELRAAQVLQFQLLPEAHPDVPGMTIVDQFLPAAELCGDYYDFFLVEDGSLDVIIADVTGHGVAPALVALQIRALTKSEAGASMPPSELVGRLNRYICANFDRTYLMSMFYLRCRPSDGRVEYVGAGHNPFVVVRHSGGVEMFRSQGTLLGVFDEAEYQQDQLALEKGDRLLLYTDGLIEVNDAEGNGWGYDRLKEGLDCGRDLPGHELLSRLITQARYHGGNRPFEDDVTLVLLERTGGRRR